MFFRIIGPIRQIEVIASGRGIREVRRLRKLYGGRRWRKLKGRATVELTDGTMCEAEIHWYDGHGVGSREFKLKRVVKVL